MKGPLHTKLDHVTEVVLLNNRFQVLSLDQDTSAAVLDKKLLACHCRVHMRFVNIVLQLKDCQIAKTINRIWFTLVK